MFYRKGNGPNEDSCEVKSESEYGCGVIGE